MNLAQQQVIDLEQQRQTLMEEFVDWRQRAEAGKKLEKHQSQLTAITAQLEGFLNSIQPLDSQTPPPFTELDEVKRYLLGAQRMWAYFRSKLALRYLEWLWDDLVCADELAWACYKPLLDKARQVGAIGQEALKEPPLIFFSGDSSPFAQARDTRFAPEGVTRRDFDDFGEALLRLPVTVIGVPWFQVNLLPTAAVIGHEVGHAVEHDFGLEAVLESAFADLDIPDSRKAGWLAWRHELFADAFGILCTGPASVMALLDYLIGDVDSIQQERVSAPNWGRYPSRHLRMLVNFELLGQLGLQDAAMEDAWNGTYKFDQMGSYKQDVAKVVAALLGMKVPTLGDVVLTDVLQFSPGDLSHVQDIALD
ncbi:MAG: hypothetical protein ACK2U9_03015, partial [Anaerolineae bacterium]